MGELRVGRMRNLASLVGRLLSVATSLVCDLMCSSWTKRLGYGIVVLCVSRWNGRLVRVIEFEI